MLFFSGYAYLGLNHHPAFVETIKSGIDLYGAVYPSSRISNTPLDLYKRAEISLSDLTQMKETVIFQSGFLAGKAALETILPGSRIYSSPFCHPAIRMGQTSEGSFDHWAATVLSEINSLEGSATPVLISDAVNPITAEVYDFSFLSHISRPALCIIDDSHGMGVLGSYGEGISGCLPGNKWVEYMISYSLSKAMNIQAGAVSCSSAERTNTLRNTSWYAATTPPAPSMLFALLETKEIYREQLLKLKDNIQFLQQRVSDKAGIYHHPELPVLVLPEALDEDYFAAKNIIISSFAYPNPEGRKINRAVITALHTKEDLIKLVEAIG
jgi:7-keto-8-aminopelargonate synthetase-like enzyme